MNTKETPLMTEAELATSIIELKLAGYLEFNGDDEVTLTTKGLIYGLKRLQSFEPKDRLAIMMFCNWNEHIDP